MYNWQLPGMVLWYLAFGMHLRYLLLQIANKKLCMVSSMSTSTSTKSTRSSSNIWEYVRLMYLYLYCTYSAILQILITLLPCIVNLLHTARARASYNIISHLFPSAMLKWLCIFYFISRQLARNSRIASPQRKHGKIIMLSLLSTDSGSCRTDWDKSQNQEPQSQSQSQSPSTSRPVTTYSTPTVSRL